jgi:hypothetical protein
VSDRYFAKVVSVQDKYVVVINAGADKGVKVGQRFLVVGLGEALTDPDTGEDLGRLEVVRGTVQATHVQDKVATLRSSEYEVDPDIKKIEKVTTKASSGIGAIRTISRLYGDSTDTITEVITPGASRLKSLVDPDIGDYVIKI